MSNHVVIEWTTAGGAKVKLSAYKDQPEWNMEVVAATAAGQRVFGFRQAGIIDHPKSGRALEGYLTLAGAGEPSNLILGLTPEAERAVTDLLAARAEVAAANSARCAKISGVLDAADAQYEETMRHLHNERPL